MPEISQGDPALACNSIDKKVPTKFERVTLLGRYAVDGVPLFYPDCPSYRAQKPLRKAKRQKLEHGEKTLYVWTDAFRFDTGEMIRLQNCLTGVELKNACAKGTAPMQLRRREAELPDVGWQRRVIGAAWKLRGSRLEIVGAVAYAMVVKKCEALVCTQRELAEAIGLKDPDHIGDLVRDLRRWGILAVNGTWVEHGAARSRRGNVYRLTQAAVHLFGLSKHKALAIGALPLPESAVDEVRSTKADQAAIDASLNAPGFAPAHPEATSNLVSPSQEIVITASRCESADESVVVSAPPTVDFGTVETDESPLPSQPAAASPPPAREDANCGSVSGFLEAETRQAATRPLGDVVGGMIRGERVIRRNVDTETDEYVTDRHRREDANRRGQRRDDAERKRDEERARAELERQLEYVRRRVPDFDAAPLDEPETLRQYRERLEREREEFLNVPRPARAPDDDSDVVAVIEQSWKSRGRELPGPLAALFRRKGGAS